MHADVNPTLANTEPSLAAIILAAGRSTRMGRPKLLLPWGSTSILGHLIHQWHTLRARQIAVVTTPSDEALRTELDRLAFPPHHRIENPDPDRGMFSSIQCAATWTGWRPDLTHWAVVLGDQPHLSPDTLRQLLACCAFYPDRICQPARHGHGRHPVIFPRRAFSALTDSSVADLKQFLHSIPGQIALCELDDPDLDVDLDHPADYQAALNRTQIKC